jgi:hypothetical protein
MRASLPRLGLAAVALALTLVLPAAAGASPAAGAAWSPQAVPGLEWVSHAWSWLQALWPGEVRPQASCGSDPDGKTKTCTASTIRPQAACGSDPNGQHCSTSTIRPQESCGSDPNGQHCIGNAAAPTSARAGSARPSAGAGARSRSGIR